MSRGEFRKHELLQVDAPRHLQIEKELVGIILCSALVREVRRYCGLDKYETPGQDSGTRVGKLKKNVSPAVDAAGQRKGL